MAKRPARDPDAPGYGKSMLDSSLPTPAPSGRTPTSQQVGEQGTITRQELEERIAQERRRVAKELHDTIGQSLTAIYLNAKFVERKLEKDVSNAVSDVFELGETIHGTVQELHGIMSRLQTGGKPSADAAGGGSESRAD